MTAKKSHVWDVQNEKTGELKRIAIAKNKCVPGFCTRKALKEHWGPLGQNEILIKVEFKLPRVPKPKKAKAPKERKEPKPLPW